MTLSEPQIRPDVSLYERDFLQWIEEQVRLLRAGQSDGLDVENIAEELDSMARSDRRALRSHFAVIQTHLLKLRFQPEARSESWLRSIGNSRSEIEVIVDDSPSLRRELPRQIGASYTRAVRDAALDTALSPKTFPAKSPFDLADILDRPIEEL